MRMQALDRLDADDTLVLGLMREHRRAGNIADGVDAGYVRLVELIDLDDAALGLHAELFQSQVFDVADHADRRDDPVYSDGFRFAADFDGGGDAIALLVEFRHLCTGMNLDALLFEALAGKG